jgi:predicted SAM-dependent methyltransferase
MVNAKISTRAGFSEKLWQAGYRLTRQPWFGNGFYRCYMACNYALRLNPLQFHARRVRKLRYLNIGCGKRARPDFINLDYAWHPGVDLMCDVRKGLPFRDGNLLGIFTEHCLEHLPMKLVADFLLKEFHRTLADDGTLRIIVPDAGLYLRLYAQASAGEPVNFPWTEKAFVTPMMYVNNCFRGYGHLYAYDFATLRVLLEAAGFKSVTRRSFGEGFDSKLVADDQYRAAESLYVEARKQ